MNKLSIEQILTRLQTKEQQDINETYSAMKKAKQDYQNFIEQSNQKLSNQQKALKSKMSQIEKELDKEYPDWRIDLMIYNGKFPVKK